MPAPPNERAVQEVRDRQQRAARPLSEAEQAVSVRALEYYITRCPMGEGERADAGAALEKLKR